MNTQSKQQQTMAKPPREYYGALDGFRGVLACVVAIYHTIWLSNINSSDFLNNGPVMVDLFFVFSGFLMFTLYNGKLKTSAQGREFLRRRIARIYPLHFFMLMLFVLFGAARVLARSIGLSHAEAGEILPFQAGASETLGSFFANLTLTQSMGVVDGLSYNAPAWTVSVEFYAYFVFLAVMMFAAPKKNWHFVLIAAMVVGLYGVLSTLKPDMDFHYDLGFWRCLGGFFTGVLTAKLYSMINYDTRNGVATFWGSALEIFTLVTLVCFVIYCPGKLQFFFAPVAMLFVLTFAIGRGAVSKVMTAKPALYLGKISYSIYLVHMLISVVTSMVAPKVLSVVFGPDWNASGFGGDLLLIPYLAVVIFISHFTYKYVERPGQKAILEYQIPNRMKRIFKFERFGSTP